MKISISIAITCVLTCISVCHAEAGQKQIISLPDVITMLSDAPLIKSHLADMQSKKVDEPLSKQNKNYTVASLKSGNIRITMGTALLNVIWIKVVDENGKPVKNEIINIENKSPLIIAPGWSNGSMLAEAKTNDSGEFVGMVVADFSSIMKSTVSENDATANLHDNNGGQYLVYGNAGVPPTIDEYGKRVSGVRPYKFTINVAGTTMEYNVDVDMGPALTISNRSGLVPGSRQWMGKITKKPAEMELIYYQRTGECGYRNDSAGNRNKSSSGNWEDEDFSIIHIRRVSLFDMPHTVFAERNDGNSNTVKLVNSHGIEESSNNEIQKILKNIKTPAANHNNYKYSISMSDFVVMDGAKGEVDVKYTVHGTQINYDSKYCLDQSNAHVFPVNTTTSSTIRADITNTIPLVSSSPKISLVVKDSMPAEPAPDPLPGVKSYSGVNLDKLVIMLNRKAIFGGRIKSLEVNQYPNYIRAYADDKPIPVINEKTLKHLSPGVFKFTYYPTVKELKENGANLVEITNIEDSSGNKSKNITSTFNSP